MQYSLMFRACVKISSWLMVYPFYSCIFPYSTIPYLLFFWYEKTTSVSGFLSIFFILRQLLRLLNSLASYWCPAKEKQWSNYLNIKERIQKNLIVKWFFHKSFWSSYFIWNIENERRKLWPVHTVSSPDAAPALVHVPPIKNTWRLIFRDIPERSYPEILQDRSVTWENGRRMPEN